MSVPDYLPTSSSGVPTVRLGPDFFTKPAAPTPSLDDTQATSLASTSSRPQSANFVQPPSLTPSSAQPVDLLGATTPGTAGSAGRDNLADPFGTRGLNLASVAKAPGSGADAFNLPGQAPTNGARLASAYPPVGKTDASAASSNPATSTGGMFGLASGRPASSPGPIVTAANNLAGAADTTRILLQGYMPSTSPTLSTTGGDGTPSPFDKQALTLAGDGPRRFRRAERLALPGLHAVHEHYGGPQRATASVMRPRASLRCRAACLASSCPVPPTPPPRNPSATMTRQLTRADAVRLRRHRCGRRFSAPSCRSIHSHERT